MKGVILCAGEGTRLRPLTYTSPKAVLPIANRPVLAYALDTLRSAGVRDVAVVLSPAHRWLADSLAGLAPADTRLHVLVQEEPLGIAHAVALAQPFIGGDEFVLYLGDNLTGAALGDAATQFRSAGAAALLMVQHVDKPQQFGVAVVAGERVTRVVEKPQTPVSSLAIAGIYFLTPDIFPVISMLRPSARGELEITDAIAGLIQIEKPVLARQLDSWWCDMGTDAGMLQANREVLDRLPLTAAAEAANRAVHGSTLQGRVMIDAGTLVQDCIIRGPAVIGPGCTLRSTFIGPYTSIGPQCRVEGSSIEHSILLEQSSVLDLPCRLTDCILGRRSRAVAAPSQSRAARLVVGDDGLVAWPQGG